MEGWQALDRWAGAHTRDLAPEARRGERSADRPVAELARSTVAVTLERAAAAAVSWPLPATLSDRVLEAMLYAGHGAQQAASPTG